MFTQTKKTASPRKLHSIHSLLTGRQFTGEIESSKTKQSFSYAPTSAALVNRKIELTGVFTVHQSGRARKAENVKATLLGTQGSLLAVYVPPEESYAQLLEDSPADGLPVTDATGSRSSVGVAYFKLSSMDNRKLGVAFDLSDVQLNGRLNPADDTARALQFWLSVAVRAVYGESMNENLASRALNEITGILKV